MEDRSVLLQLLDSHGREQGLSIRRSEDLATLIGRLATIAPPADHEFYGMRVERMFGYVAKALGHCKIIKSEDTGDTYSDDSVQPPDFRIVTKAGEEFLVEVKNCHAASNPDYEFRLKQYYVDKIESYAKAFSLTIKVAVYWSRIKMWTLVSLDNFKKDEKGYFLSCFECMKMSEMNILGDARVATTPPLFIQLTNDEGNDSTIAEDGTSCFKIGSAEQWCGDSVITDEFERKLAWFFMMFGGWEFFEDAEVVDGRLISFRFGVKPEPIEGQDFNIIGSLSQMISSQYDMRTGEDGEVYRLVPNASPDAFGIEIPSEYKGTVLKLWRFIQKPNYD